jgi:hypothetical protein
LGHGISAGAGKVRAFIGAHLFPVFFAWSLGMRGAMVIAGVVAVAGAVVTAMMLPEPKGRNLEDLAEEARGADLRVPLRPTLEAA